MLKQRSAQRSRGGIKRYAVRDAEGRFLGLQAYKHAHRADLAKKSELETAQKRGDRT
jgi:hypothetical protein